MRPLERSGAASFNVTIVGFVPIRRHKVVSFPYFGDKTKHGLFFANESQSEDSHILLNTRYSVNLKKKYNTNTPD